MEIRPIRTEEDYKAALREVSAYFDNEPTPSISAARGLDVPAITHVFNLT